MAYYPVHGRIVRFPFEDSPQAEAYAADVLRDLHDGFAIYGGARQVTFWQQWFAARPELRGWNERLDRFGDVYVAYFSLAR
jgi:hypothetical protein